MKKRWIYPFCLLACWCACTRDNRNDRLQSAVLGNIVTNDYSAVKDQGYTGDCWSFGVVSMLESESYRRGVRDLDLSEFYIVRNEYIEKAKQYIQREGAFTFQPATVETEALNVIRRYGLIPETIYSGMKKGQTIPNPGRLPDDLKQYLDDVLKSRPIPDDWLKGYTRILDKAYGLPPAKFEYRGKQYTPQTFARDFMQFNPQDYIALTSFSHQPFFKPFILEFGDNYSNQYFYNIPVDELVAVVQQALSNHYTVVWDGDISNDYFRKDWGIAMLNSQQKNIINPDLPEDSVNQARRQELFENLTTIDDHIMHIVGMDKSAEGKVFFKIKDSHGIEGPYNGMIEMSMAYFALNTTSILLPREAVSPELKKKLGID